jgi:pimeloyl-ACP methyl ester carboxylesterase
VSGRLAFALVSLATAGCSGIPAQKTAWSPPSAQVSGVVFAADGAGSLGGSSVALQKALVDAKVPLEVKPVAWSHRSGRILADQMDYAHARAEGERLAAEVRACRQARPTGRIYLVGHSAGSAVVLSAVEALPPGSVDGIALLAPAISAQYDLRPALRRCPIDVFYSAQDRFYLGVGVAIVGTTDRHWSAAAGRTGFQVNGHSADDQALFARLHQHPWSAADERTDNYGGHFDGIQQAFLRVHVVPLLTVN